MKAEPQPPEVMLVALKPRYTFDFIVTFIYRRTYTYMYWHSAHKQTDTSRYTATHTHTIIIIISRQVCNDSNLNLTFFSVIFPSTSENYFKLYFFTLKFNSTLVRHSEIWALNHFQKKKKKQKYIQVFTFNLHRIFRIQVL